MLEHAEFFDWAVKAILAASFGGWAWIIKTFGEKHVASLDSLAAKIDKITEQLTELNVRLTVLEHDWQAKNKGEG